MSSKAATSLVACFREEQQAVIHFLSSEGEKPADIHRRMKRYWDTSVQLQHICRCHRKFKGGMSNLVDAARSGWNHTTNRSDTNTELERMIQSNRWVTIDQVTGRLTISYDLVNHIIHEVLSHKKSPPRGYQKQLTFDLKERFQDVCETLL